MSKRRDKQLMISMLKYPAKLFYKDDHMVILIPKTEESFVHFLDGAHGFRPLKGFTPNLWTNETTYIVQTTKEERFLIKINYEEWSNNNFQFVYSPKNMSHVAVIARYPSLKKAFADIAKKVSYLPLIDNQTAADVHAAIKKNPINVKFVNNLTQKSKLRLVELFPNTFEHMDQNPELVSYVMEHTDVFLGEVSSQYRTAYICKLGIKKNPSSIKYVPNPHKTDQLMISAVKQDPRALREISHPTLEMYVAAVKAGKSGWDYVPKSLKKKVKKAL